MQHEVIVVGGGIGGLTTAALLAARGVDVCLLERQSQVGGCVANFEHLGYSFTPTAGLYSGWESGGTWEKVFSELPVGPPRVTKLSPNYVVRLPDGRDVEITNDRETFEHNIAHAFSDCSDAALRFFRAVDEIGNKSSPQRVEPVETLLRDTSRDFRIFIDAQLQTFGQRTSSDCSVFQAAMALRMALGDLFSISGDGQALADRLAESLKRSGGLLRLNSPVLRLAYGSDGAPMGVDLLNGERVVATRGIISNLTIWDTYGKLIGLNRTPPEISTQLRKASAWGSYLIFISVDEEAASGISPRLLLTNDLDAEQYDPTSQLLFLNFGSANVASAPAGKRAMTAWTFTHAEDWFSFHEDSSAHDERDQQELEKQWNRLHAALPEIGDRAEVIETATPQTFYENTRRKFGMTGLPSLSLESRTPFPNMFLVNDTVAGSFGIEAVARLALNAATSIAGVRL